MSVGENGRSWRSRDGTLLIHRSRPKRAKVENNASATVDFSFATAGHVVNGSVRDSTSRSLVSSMWAWAYARTYDANNPDTFDVITDGPVDGGEFTLKLPAGTYRIGLWISPDSDYSMSVDPSTNLAEVEVTLSGDESTSTADVLVEKNNAVISGTFLDADGEAVTNLDGEVFAVQEQLESYIHQSKGWHF